MINEKVFDCRAIRDREGERTRAARARFMQVYGLIS